MDWLSNWDDLVHGTAVFSAAIPFLLTLALCWKVPARWWWALVVVAIAPVAYWLFKLPEFPPVGSDDVAGSVLLAAVGILAAELALARWVSLPLRFVLRLVVFGAIGWSVYPAWLSEDGGATRKLLVVGGFGLSIGLCSIGAELLGGRKLGDRFSLTPAAFIPPTIALAVLLQTGGSMRFAQIVGALAAALGAVCLASLIWRKPERQGRVGGFWGMLFVALAWSGWLFAEIRYGLAVLLLCAPLAAALLGLIPLLPRKNLFLCLLWDFVGAALVAAPIAVVVAIKYAEEMAEFEGY